MNSNGIKPKVSVIMAVYNAAAFLAEAIESVFRQTLADFELIAVDDCSDDRSLAILRSYAGQDKRLRLIVNRRRLGQAVARNLALVVARGEYMAIGDADDILMPERLERQYVFLTANSDCFLCSTDALVIDESSRRIGSVIGPKNFIWSPNLLLQKNILVHSSVMFRQGVNYREKFLNGEDYDLYLRLLSAGKKLVNLPETLVAYRVRKQSVNYNLPETSALIRKKIQQFYRQRIISGFDDYERFRVDQSADGDELKKAINFLKIKIHFGLLNSDRVAVKTSVMTLARFYPSARWYLWVIRFFMFCPLAYKYYRMIFRSNERKNHYE